MSYTYSEGVAGVRSGVFQRYSTSDRNEANLYVDGRVAAVVQSDFGPTDEVTVLTSPNDIKKVYGTGGTTDVLKYAFLGGATEVYAIRLGGTGAKKATTKIKANGPVKVINLTKGTEKAGETIETAEATFTFSKNQLTVAFSNVPEGYKPSVRVKGQVGILGFLPGKFYDTELSNGNKHIITYNLGAPINGEMTVEACLTKDKIQVLKSCTYTCAQEDEDKEFTIPLELKYPGEKQLNLQIKQDLKNSLYKVLNILENGEIIESINFITGEEVNEIENLKVALENSNYINATGFPEEALTTSVVQEVASQAFTGGANPVITTSSYSNCFEVLGRYRFNTLALDTIQADVTALAKEFTVHQAENGRYAILTIGTQKGTNVDDRIAEVKKFDDHNVVVVGPGYIDVDGNEVDEYLFAAQIAGMIAGISSRYAITGKNVQGAVKLTQQFSNDEYIKADQNGLVTITVNDLDEIEIELGITSLTTLKEGVDDKGWQKIKRTKTRNEMFQRITLTLAPYKGNLEPDENAKTFIRGKIEQILDEMAAEKKISPTYTVEVTDEIDNPNAFCYQIVPYDYDAVEQFYLHYIFRYKE